MSVRESTFTLRIEPALRRMAERQKSVRVAAMSTGIPIGDVRLWVAEFNDGREDLTLARLNEVKHELGILKVSERPAGEPRKPVAPIAATPAPAPDSARNVGELPDREVAPKTWPWFAKNRIAAVKAAARWMPVLELYRDPEVTPRGRLVGQRVREIGNTMGSWNQFKLAYFGPSGGFTPEAVNAFIASFPVVPSHPRIDLTHAQPRPAAAAEVDPRLAKSIRKSEGGVPSKTAAAAPAEVSFDEALAELGILIGAYQALPVRRRASSCIRRGICTAITEGAELLKKEASE